MNTASGNVVRFTPVRVAGGNVEPMPPPQVGGTDGGDGGMDDVLKRLHTVEQTVSDIRSDVAGVKTSIPYLATRADISDVKTSVSNVESSLIKWIVGTLLAAAVLAFTIARYVAPA